MRDYSRFIQKMFHLGFFHQYKYCVHEFQDAHNEICDEETREDPQ